MPSWTTVLEIRSKYLSQEDMRTVERSIHSALNKQTRESRQKVIKHFLDWTEGKESFHYREQWWRRTMVSSILTACSLSHTTFENMRKEGTGEWLFLFYYVPSLCFPQMGMWQTVRTQWRTPGWVSHPQHERFCTIFDKSRKNGNNHG